jgi:rubrerythrin
LRPLGIDVVRRQARQMEQDAARFYQQAAGRTSDAAIRKLLGDLAAAEEAHEDVAARIEAKRLPGDVRANEDDDARRRFYPADHSAWAGRIDGRFGVDIGAGFRRRFRHA